MQKETTKKVAKPVDAADRKNRQNVYWKVAKPVSSSDRKTRQNVYW